MNPTVIKSLYNQYRHASMQSLTKALTEICSENFLWINHLGESFDREGLLKMVSDGLLQYEKWTSEEQTIRVVGEDCAILNARDHVIMLREPKKVLLISAVTAVFYKYENGWKLLGGQSTDVPKTLL